MNDIKQYIEQYTKLLPVGKSISYTEAERRAGEFLSAMATLSDYKHILSEDKIRLLTVQTVTYASEMSKGTAKTVTENKLSAEASGEYIKAREELERIENDISYVKAMYDVFNNAHIFFRTMAKGVNE